MKKFIYTFLVLIIPIYLNGQWQYCGNYTSYIVQFEVKDSILFAGTYGNGVYITSDGENWTYSNNGMTAGQIISFAVINNSIFAGTETEGIYRSTNNGINWITVNNGISNLTIHCLSSDGYNLYAATSNGVNVSTNNGDNWTRISYSYVGTVIFSVLAYQNRIIATSANGIFITNDGGLNWNNITTGTSGYIYCLSRFNNDVYAGSSTSGIFKTTNNGLNWIQTGTGLPSGKAVRKISIADGKIFAALYNSGGIYYLPLSGSTWIQANQGLTQLSCYTVIEFKNYIFAGTVGGIFRRPSGEFTSVNKIDNLIPNRYRLYQNYPNPFNPVTKIKFDLNKTGVASLIIYDINGREIAKLINEKLSAGSYETNWDGSFYSSGIYFYKLETDNFSSTKFMVLIK